MENCEGLGRDRDAGRGTTERQTWSEEYSFGHLRVKPASARGITTSLGKDAARRPLGVKCRKTLIHISLLPPHDTCGMLSSGHYHLHAFCLEQGWGVRVERVVTGGCRSSQRFNSILF
ncbi:hypothetical protein BaRGS_00039698 [Batillaria attramentaria]|uniref:Uncharacterized protein n=1 Tax=Batillaria attramentaria TaxID=370345 RepID=A0ABD0J2C4_9CAEN